MYWVATTRMDSGTLAEGGRHPAKLYEWTRHRKQREGRCFNRMCSKAERAERMLPSFRVRKKEDVGAPKLTCNIDSWLPDGAYRKTFFLPGTLLACFNRNYQPTLHV